MVGAFSSFVVNGKKTLDRFWFLKNANTNERQTIFTVDDNHITPLNWI